MRMGAIFARGSCRALKWMALFGVVFALGAGQAFAQLTITPPKTVAEGGSAMIPVEAKVSIAGGASAAMVTVGTVAAAVRTTDLSAAQIAADVTQGEEDADSNGNPQDLVLDIPANAGATDITRTVTGTIIWQTRPDLDAEDEAFTLTFTVTNSDSVIGQDAGETVLAGPTMPSDITIDDAQTQMFVMALDPNQTPVEAGSAMVTLRAMYPPVDLTYDVALAVNETGYSVMPNAWQFAADDDDDTNAIGPSGTLTVSAPANDKNRDDDKVMLTALAAGTVDDVAESVEIGFKDLHGLPESDKISAQAFMVDEDDKKTEEMAESVKEGDTVVITVTVDRGEKGYPLGEKLEVTLMTDSAQVSDRRFPDGNTVEIAAESGEQTADITLEASLNDDIGPEMLMLNLVAKGKNEDNGPGESSATFSIMIDDDTRRQVEALPEEDLMPIIYGAIDEGDGDDDKFNPGEKIELDASTLFKPTEYNISYSVDSDMMDVAGWRRTGSMVTVEALMEGGPAQITITATATGMTSGAKPLPQTSPIFAQVIFSVTVEDTPLVVKVSTDPMDMVEEGGMVKVTATSTRDILAGEEVVVMLDVNGPATGPDSITIPAGMSSGSIDLMVNDDEMVAPMNDIVITATGPGIDGATVLTVSVTEDDMETTYSVAPAAVSVTEGGEGMTITATASQAVLAATEVMLMHGAGSASAGDYGLDPTSITIEAGGTSGTTMVTATEDTDVEGTETVTLNAMVGTMSVGMVEVTIEDNDMETTYSVAPAAVSVTEGGEGMTITATASQAVLANTEVMLMHGAGSASADDYGLVPVSITIMTGDTEGSTTLTATDDDDYEGMEAVTLNAMIGTMSVGMVEVTIEDDDMPTTYELAPATGMVDEGGEAAVITATASQAVMEDTMVSLTATGGTASADDYSVDAITITAGEASGSTMLMANDDYDVEGMETLTLQGSIGAMIIGSVMFEIGDNDMEITVELSSEDMNIVEGDMDAANGTKAAAMLTATASSAVQVDTTVTIMRDGSSSAVMADFTAAPITITAGETVGTTMVMAVEDDMMEDMEMLTLYGEVDGMNTNMVSFYIWDAAVPALPLIAQLLLAMFLAIGGYRRYLRR